MKPTTRTALNYLYFVGVFVFSVYCLFDLSFDLIDSVKYFVALLWVCGVFNQILWVERQAREQNDELMPEASISDRNPVA